MKPSEEIKKRVGVEDYLRSKGIEPKRSSSKGFWYCSPMRDDKKPSFVVKKGNQCKSLWNDLATGESGNVIDLCMLLEGCDAKTAINLLSSIKGLSSNINSFPLSSSSSEIAVLGYYPLNNSKNIDYLKGRDLCPRIASKYVYQVQISLKDRRVWCMGWRTVNGWELVNITKNGSRKLSTAKGPTIINPNHKRVVVFEAMFDFIAYLTHKQTTPTSCTVVVLNGSGQVNRVDWSKFDTVYYMGDNDTAGDAAMLEIKQKTELLDKREMFSPCKDYNEHLSRLHR